MRSKTDEEYSEEDAAKRARDAIERSFKMPYKPQKDLVGTTSRARARKPKRTKGSCSTGEWALEAPRRPLVQGVRGSNPISRPMLKARPSAMATFSRTQRAERALPADTRHGEDVAFFKPLHERGRC